MTALFRTRRFWPLFGAQSLGAFADNTLRNAAITAIAYAAVGTSFYTGEGFRAASGPLVSAAFTLPILLFSTLAGQVADLVPRHLLIRRLKFLECGLMVAAAIVFALGWVVPLLLILFLMGAQSAFFSPVRNAVMPHFFKGTELFRANGYFNAAMFVALVSGLFLGGMLINMPGGRMIVSALLIAAATGGALLAMAVPPAPAPGRDLIDWHLPRAAWMQIKAVASHKGVVYPLLGIAWFWFVGAAVLAHLPAYAREGLGTDEQGYAQLIALSAIGAGVGSIGAGFIAGKMKDGLTLAGLGAGGTILGTLAIWALSPSGPEALPAEALQLFTAARAPLLLAFVFTAAANSVFAVPLMAALQARAPEESRARMMGVGNMTNGAGATIGALTILAVPVIGLPTREVFLGLALLQIGLVAFMIRRSGVIRAAAQAA